MTRARPVPSRIGIVELVRTGVGAARTMPADAAVLLFAAAMTSALAGARYPATASIAAVAAVCALPAAALPVTALASAALAIHAFADGPVWAAAPPLAAFVAILPRGLRSPPPPEADGARAAWFVAAQGHTWAFVLAMALVAAADCVAGTGGERRNVAALFLPIAAVGVAPMLTIRTRDAVARLAPLALGIPLAAAGIDAAALVHFGMPPGAWLWVLIGAAVPVIWNLGFAYLFGRHPADTRLSRAMAWVVAAVAAGLCASHVAVLEQDFPVLALCVPLLPFLVCAAATFSTDAGRGVVRAVLLCVGAATLALAFGPSRWMGAADPLFGVVIESRPIAGASEMLLRIAECAALVAGIGALLHRARALTAIPRDHPVFTEGPHVPRSVWRHETEPAAATA